MRVLASRQGDVELPGGTVKAVFPGQVYDLPDEVAAAGIGSGLLKAAEPVEDKAQRPVSDKAIQGPRGRRAP